MVSRESSYHDIIKAVPLKITLSNHGCSNQRTDCCPQSICSMQEAKHLISVFHISDPGIPSTVLQTISKSCQHENNGKNCIRWMDTSNNISNNLAGWGNDGDSKLAEAHVNLVVQQGGSTVA